MDKINVSWPQSLLDRNDIAGAVSFIEQEVERDTTKMKRLGLRSFFVRLLQSEANMEEGESPLIERFRSSSRDQ